MNPKLTECFIEGFVFCPGEIVECAVCIEKN